MIAISCDMGTIESLRYLVSSMIETWSAGRWNHAILALTLCDGDEVLTLTILTMKSCSEEEEEQVPRGVQQCVL